MVNASQWQVVVPVVGPRWNEEQFIESVGKVEVPFLIVDNSVNRDSMSIPVPKEIEVRYYPNNAGISASWNLGLAKGAKWTLVLSVSTRFKRGLMSWLDEAQHWVNDFGLTTPIGFHCHVVGRDLIDLVGDFDPNIWPGYLEDTDWYYRRDHEPQYNKHTMPMFRSDDLSFIADAVAVRSGSVPDQCIPQREKYFVEKWGGMPGQQKFLKPFGDKDIKYYPNQGWIGKPSFYE